MGLFALSMVCPLPGWPVEGWLRKKGQPNANQFTDASQSPLWGQDKDGAAVPVSGDAERPQMAS
jgi:hypothetical protein